MTIEKKAKAYDGLIERLKDLKFAYRFSPISDTIEEVFPELKERKESEDDMIRKALIDGFKRYDDGALFNGCLVREILPWLEKQGKNKSIDDLTQQEAMDIAVAKCFNEQKHIDKVEPKFKIGDKIYLKPEYRMPDDDTPIANTVKEIIGIDDKHYKFDGSYIFIEDQDKYELVEQNPAWSEEDERNLEWLMTVCERIHYKSDPQVAPESALILREWLKSLKERVLPKQEWSDEDEKKIDSIIETIRIRKFEHPQIAPVYEGDIDWLKSLKERYTWKPSNKQMDALLFVVQHYTPNVTDKLAWDSIKILELMYYEIKK
jgi:hypothetical protein